MRSIFTTFLLVALSVFAANCARAATVCVIAGDSADFQTQLTSAIGATSTTLIEVPRGTYQLSGTPLTFNSTAVGQGQFDISGGFNSDCSGHINDPSLTVIDGGGLSAVMSLTSTAGVSVRYLTIQNGNTDSIAGLGVVTTGGGIIIDYNIIRNNVASFATGGLFVENSTSNGTIRVDGNLIVGNSAGNAIESANATIANEGSGNTYVTNNTVTGNTITGTPITYGAGLMVYGVAIPNVSNNILWGNSPGDLYAHSTSTTLTDNDCGVIDTGDTTSSGEVSVDPQFVGGGNYQLSAASPLLGQGTTSPLGGLPTIDILGHDREFDAATATVDMGAYEHGDEIYNNNFDD